MKVFVLAAVWFVTLAGTADAGGVGALLAPDRPVVRERLTRIDWQDPASLPRQLRDHCTTEGWSGRPYCADHCGRDFQVYYCSQDSFGCCRVGYGYCDDRGHLRCHP